MGYTSDTLVDCCNKDEFPPSSVICDYFGLYLTTQQVQNILGMYQNMIKQHHVTSADLHHALTHGGLTEYVDKINNTYPSHYYLEYKKMNMQLGTYIKKDLNEEV